MLLYNLIHANNDAEQPLYHDLINRLVDYDIDTDLSSSMVGYSVDGLMLGAFENMRITSNIYGNTPITAKALDYIQIDNGLIDPFPNGSVTIETGKITCGDHFTSSNTPYSRDECQNCGIEEQIGSSVAPQTSGKTPSNRMNMPTVEEMEALTADTRNNIENSVFAYPNPTADFCRLETKEELQKITLVDQRGVQVKEFSSLDRTIDLQELASGVYTLVIIFTSNQTEYVQIIKL